MQTIETDERVFVITDACEVIVLRMLLWQAIPMLKRPQDYGRDRRQNLVSMIGLALDGMDISLEEDEERRAEGL